MRSMQASTEDYRRKREHRIAIARSIWPTGKPARPISAREVEAHCAKVRLRLSVYRYHPVQVKALLPDAFAAFVHDRRTRGIAEGRRLAAARVRRFVAWLRDCPGIAHAVAIDHACSSLSPEQAVTAAADEGFHWPFVATEWGVRRRREADPWEWAALGVELLASPEWAALPWQREAGR